MEGDWTKAQRIRRAPNSKGRSWTSSRRPSASFPEWKRVATSPEIGRFSRVFRRRCRWLVCQPNSRRRRRRRRPSLGMGNGFYLSAPPPSNLLFTFLLTSPVLPIRWRTLARFRVEERAWKEPTPLETGMADINWGFTWILINVIRVVSCLVD